MAAVLALVGCSGADGTSPAASGGSGAAVAADRDAGWRSDLDALVRLREERHPDPWHGIDRADYLAAVRAVQQRVPDLSDDELMVEAVRLAAMPTWSGRDGHGGIYPWGEGEYAVHMFPLRLYLFSDGFFVVDALPPHQGLVGAQVVAIAGHPVDVVLDAVEPLVPRDNEQQVLSQGPRLMVAAEVLHGLGLLDDPRAPTTFTVRVDGAGSDVAMTAVPMPDYEAWAGGHHSLSPPERPGGAAWLRDVETSFWWELDERSRTAHVLYNTVAGGTTELAEQVQVAVDAGRVDRLLIDLRHNSGGDNTTYGPMLDLLEHAQERDVPTYLATSRSTFSAAGNFVAAAEALPGTVLVGEASGGSPNQFGDSLALPLEHSGLVFRVAPEYVVSVDDADVRTTIEPDLPVALTAADYFGDRDPVLEAVVDAD
jgi:hypothetical protein